MSGLKSNNNPIPPESQEWLQLGLDVSTVGIWDWDKATDQIIWDARMHKLFGIPNGSFDGKFETFLSMIHADDRNMVKETFLASWTGSEIDLQFKVIWPDGSLHVINAQGGPIYNGSEPIKLMGACNDLTDIADDKIKQSHQFIRHLAEASPDILFVMNMNTLEVIYANRNFPQVLGYTDEQMAQMKSVFFDILHPDDHQRMLQHFEDVKKIANGEIIEIDYRMIDAKGNVRWFTDRNSVFKRDENGIPVEKLGVTHETTETILLQQETERNLTILNSAQRLANMGSWDYEIATGKMVWSDEMYKLVDMEPGTPVTPDIYLDLVIEEDIVLAKRLIRKIVQDYKSFEEVIRIKTRTGEIKIMKVKGVVIKDNKGEPVRIVGIDHDITVQKEAAGKITERNKELRRLNEELIREEKERHTLEKLLDEEKQLTAAVIEGIPSGIIMFDNDLNIKIMNAAAAGILSVPKEEARSLYTIMQGFMAEEHGLLLHKVLKGECSSLQKVKALNSDNYFNITINPIKSRKKIQGGIIFLEDVTTSVKLKEQLEQKNIQLQTVINNMTK